MSRNIDQTKSVENSSTVSSRDDLSYVNHISNDSSNEQPLTKSLRRLSCTVCNLDFTNQKQFSSHLNSQLHQENQSIHDVLQSVAPEYRSTYKTMFTSEILNKKVFNRELRCYEQIKLIKEPLLGLNYIIEFQFENLTDPPQYICELCHCKCSLQAILLHLVNTEHQKKFLKNHHPDMYERVLSASHVRCEQQRLIENYAKQIQSRHGGPGNVQLHVQLEKLIGQKPVVLAVNYKLQSTSNSKGQNKVAIQLTSKTFQDYDYPYEDETNKGNKEFVSDQIVNNHEDSIQHGLTPEDLLYPFDRQFWYDNYKDLLESRPIDPHSVTYQEIIPEKDDLKPFQSIDKSDSSTIPKENLQITLENGQTIRRNHNQSSNRRVILESNRTTTITSNGSLRISPNKTSANFDGYALLNEQQKKSNGTNAVLNEQSARAILAASGLLRSDDEGEDDKDERTMKNKDKSEKTVSPAIAKRMLDAVLNGDLDVAHIQPYFSTFVNLIQSGQVELERHQAERLLHKVLVTSSTSPTLKVESKINSNKRTRSDSYSKEYHSSSTRRQVYHDSENYSSIRESNYERHPSSSSSSTIATSTTRRVHLINENKPTNGK